MTHPKLEFSIDKCFKLFEQSLNRVKYFSCITDNLTINSLPETWIIKNESGLSYDIGKPEEDKKEMLIGGYKYYMQRYLVRDCIENFALCLDELFFVLLINGKIVLPNKKFIDCLSEKEAKLYRKFSKNFGLEEKANELEKSFGLSILPDYKKIIINLKQIRNCLSHSNGIVREDDGEEDENDKTRRKFHWAAFTIFAVGESGKQFQIEFGKPLPEASKICIKNELKDHFKSFQIGLPLSFSSSDAYEIALSLDSVAKAYLQEINKIIKPTSSNEK